MSLWDFLIFKMEKYKIQTCIGELTAVIEYFSGESEPQSYYIGYVKEYKGVVVNGISIQHTLNELQTSINVWMDYESDEFLKTVKNNLIA